MNSAKVMIIADSANLFHAHGADGHTVEALAVQAIGAVVTPEAHNVCEQSGLQVFNPVQSVVGASVLQLVHFDAVDLGDEDVVAVLVPGDAPAGSTADGFVSPGIICFVFLCGEQGFGFGLGGNPPSTPKADGGGVVFAAEAHKAVGFAFLAAPGVGIVTVFGDSVLVGSVAVFVRFPVVVLLGVDFAPAEVNPLPRPRTMRQGSRRPILRCIRCHRPSLP